MENTSQENPIQVNPQPESKKFPRYLIIILVIAGILIAGYFVLAKNQNWWPFEEKTNLTSEWKTYVDDKNHFSFNYPSNWSLSKQVGDSSDNLLFKNEAGKSVIYIAPHLRNLNYDYQNTLKKGIKLSASVEYMGVQKVENILLEKIVDTDQTLGYLSQWKIFTVGKTFIETRADFESKLEAPLITATGKYKRVLSLVGQKGFDGFDDLNLIKFIASTFHFNR